MAQDRIPPSRRVAAQNRVAWCDPPRSLLRKFRGVELVSRPKVTAHSDFAGDHVRRVQVYEGNALLDGPGGDQADGAWEAGGHLERGLHCD